MRPRTGSDRLLVAALVSSIVSTALPGRADAPPADATLAETLFREAKKKMADGDYARACPMFAESQRLDPGGGTILALALCHEAEGKTATAWAELDQALTMALRDGNATREAVARQHAASLEGRLARLRVEVSPDAASLPGLVVTRDGEALAAPAWGIDAPVDPGTHTIRASAPGRTSWSDDVVAEAGTTRTITIPTLARVAAEEPPRHEREAPPPATPTWPRTLGFVAGGASVAALGLGAFLFVRAYDQHRDARNACPSDACPDRAAVDLDASAKRNGDRATIAGVVGVGLAAASIGLFVWGDRLAVKAGPAHAEARYTVLF